MQQTCLQQPVASEATSKLLAACETLLLSRSTINRIASGEQRNINQEMLDVICALAGISPCAKLDLFSTHAQEMQERQRRLEDAEEALKNGANSIGDIIDAIFFGIEQRVKELRGS